VHAVNALNQVEKDLATMSNAVTAPRILGAEGLRNTTRHVLVFNSGTPHEVRLEPVSNLRPHIGTNDEKPDAPAYVCAGAVFADEEAAAAAGVPTTERARHPGTPVTWPCEGVPIQAALDEGVSFFVEHAHIDTFRALRRNGFFMSRVWCAEGALYSVATGRRCLEASGGADEGVLEMRVTRIVEHA
jgi:hypothetical protein